MSNIFKKLEVVTVESITPFELLVTGDNNESHLMFGSPEAQIIVNSVNVGEVVTTMGIQD